MLEELNKVNKENLPQKVGETLKKELEELEALREYKQEASAELVTLKEAKAENAIRINDLNDQLNKHKELDKRERELEEKARNIKVEILEMRVQANAGMADAFKEFMINMSKNTTFKRSISATVPVTVPGTPGGNGMCPSPGYVSQENSNSDETVTEE